MWLRTGYAVSDEKGSFEVKEIDASDYSVCVLIQDPSLLNPCRWPTDRVNLKLKDRKSTRLNSSH